MNIYKGLNIGTVVFNDDPTKCERIKVTIPSIFEGPHEELPWVAPNLSRWQGQGNGKGWFGVPSVGSKVYIKFQDGDPAFPIYEGGVVSVETLIPEAAEDYPHCWGYVDAIGNKLITNTKTGVTKIIHHSGTVTVIEADGTVNETVKGDWNVTVSGDWKVDVSGNTSLSSTGPSSVTSSSAMAVAGQGLSFDSGTGGASGGKATMKGDFHNEGTFHSTESLSSDGDMHCAGNLTVAGSIDAGGSIHGSNI